MEFEIILGWIPLAAAGIAAAGSVAGGLLSSSGAGSANASNLAMNANNIALQERMNYFNAGEQARANVQNMEMQYAVNAANIQNQQDINSQNIQMQQATNEWNAAQVQKQMDFQERMSNTSYQRAMADMEKAGLNPILAYQQGGASSMAGGAAVGQAAKSQAATAVAPRVEAFRGQAGQNTFPAINTQADLGRAIGSAVTSAMEAAKTYQGVELAEQQTKTEQYKQRNLHMDSAKKIEEAFKTSAEIDQVKAYTNILKSQGVVAAIEALDADKYGSKLTPESKERLGRMLQDALERLTGYTSRSAVDAVKKQ